jgi:hypothetical protein
MAQALDAPNNLIVLLRINLEEHGDTCNPKTAIVTQTPPEFHKP